MAFCCSLSLLALSIRTPSHRIRNHCDNLVTIFQINTVNRSDVDLPADGFNSL